MSPDHTLVVVADGGGARAFVEKQRHGPLEELPSFTVSNQSPRPRGGYGSHDFVRASEAEEKSRLNAVAEAINATAQRGAYGHVVLMAPSRALGALRAGLEPRTAALVELEEPKDRRGQSLDQIRAALKHLRSPQ
jgi:protein required for attachment to host cells